MTRAALQALLRLAPTDFRDRCGDEFLVTFDWRRSRRPGPGARLLLSLREISGMLGVVLRLRGRELGRRLSAAWMRNPRNRTGMLLAGGILLLLVGNALGFGAGLRFGFGLSLVALVLIALGLSGRAAHAPGFTRASTVIARVTAASAAALAPLIVLMTLADGPLEILVTALCYAVAGGLFLGVSIFGGRGILKGELPVIPAAAVSLGGALIAAGMIGLEGVALIGFWISVPGWVALAVVPWGRQARA